MEGHDHHAEKSPEKEEHAHGHPHENNHAGSGAHHSHHAEKATPNASRALLIGLILVLVIGTVGILIYTKFFPGNTNTIDDAGKVSVKLLVDASCAECYQYNTILIKFDISNIKYNLETIDIHSAEGAQLVKDFNVSYAPTALVSLKGLDQNTTVQGALQGQFVTGNLVTKNGWIVVPELFLDQQPRLLSFTSPPVACTAPEGKASIIAYLDYGDCVPCLDAYKSLSKLAQEDDSISVKYEPVLYSRSTTELLNAAFITNKGGMCAEKLGYLDSYTECNYFNAQFYGNINYDYMKSCIIEAGAKSKEKQEEFKACVQDDNGTINLALQANNAQWYAWNPIKYAPSFVLDCKYSFVGSDKAEEYLCAFHPELSFCHAAMTDTDTPASDANGTA